MLRKNRVIPALLLLAACSDTPFEPPGLSTGFQYSFTDPVGDTLPPPANVFNRALDVKGIDVGLTAESIFVRVEFTAPISRWSATALNSIDGFLDFDFDDNASTGLPSATEEIGGVSAGMGVESYVSLRDDGSGHLMRRVCDTEEWQSVPVQFAERSFTVRLARADVGETDGAFRVSAMIGGTNRVVTDLVPGSGHHRVSN